jgi:hypothetical protein
MEPLLDKQSKKRKSKGEPGTSLNNESNTSDGSGGEENVATQIQRIDTVSLFMKNEEVDFNSYIGNIDI